MTSAQPGREEIHGRAAALPLVGAGEVLDDPRAEQILLDLKRRGSRILAHVQMQIDQVIDELKPEWTQTETGQFVLSEGEILTIVARAARRGAGQAASDIGGTLSDIASLEMIFAATPVEEPPTAA